MKKYSFFIGFFILGVATNSCSDDAQNIPSDEKAKLELRLTDAPANFDAVYIDVVGISYKMSTGDWQTYNTVPKVYDLLELNNGLDVVLGN